MSCCPKHRTHGATWWIVVGLVLAVALVAATASADALKPSRSSSTAPLGLEDAARLALENQPQLASQSAGIDALHENAIAARQLPDPRLRFGVVSLPIDSFNFTQEPMTQAIVGINQTLPGGRKLALSGQRMTIEADSAAQALEASRRRIARDARLAWLDRYLPSTAALLTQELVAEYQRQIEWSEIAYKTGQMSQDESLALRGQLELTRDREAEQQRQQQRGIANLARWVGDEAAQRPLDALLDDAAAPDLPTLEAGLEQHPELHSLNLAIAASQADAEQARQAYKPDWNLDLAYGYRGDDGNNRRSDFVSVVVGVDLPVFTANRQDRRLQARLAGVEQSSQKRDDRRRSLAAELHAAWADWQAAQQRIQRFEQDILPLAQRRIESALNAYGTSKVNYGRVIEARRAQLEARLSLLGQKVARARAAAQLQYFAN